MNQLYLIATACCFLVLGTEKASAAQKLDESREDERAFQHEVSNLLYAEKFTELNALVTDINEKQMRFSDGEWKLTTFFNGVSYPKTQSGIRDWKGFSELLRKWDKSERTVFTLNATALFQLHQAWESRGTQDAFSVKDEQWKGFEEYLGQAAETLKDAIPLRKQCPDVYHTLLRLGLGQGWPREKMDSIYQEFLQQAPEYYPCHEQMAVYLLERWYGAKGDWEKFLDAIPAKIQGDAGFDVYTRVALSMYRYPKEEFFAPEKEVGVHWPHMKHGFEVMMRRWPDSSWNLNKFAFYAVRAKDVRTAKLLVDEIVEKNLVRPFVWNTPEYFEKVKAWAQKIK